MISEFVSFLCQIPALCHCDFKFWRCWGPAAAPANFIGSWEESTVRNHPMGEYSMEFPSHSYNDKTSNYSLPSPIGLMIKGWTFGSGFTHLGLWAFIWDIRLIVQCPGSHCYREDYLAAGKIAHQKNLHPSLCLCFCLPAGISDQCLSLMRWLYFHNVLGKTDFCQGSTSWCMGKINTCGQGKGGSVPASWRAQNREGFVPSPQYTHLMFFQPR